MIIVPIFKKIPAKYRVVLFLKFFEDRTYKEIAEILGRPIGTVKAQCHRGLNYLRKSMQPFQTSEHLKEKKRNKKPDMDKSKEEVKDYGF